jgi:hypothetical protein
MSAAVMPSSSCILPKWFQLALIKHTGHVPTVRADLPCLDANWKKSLPDEPSKIALMGHMEKSLCAKMLAEGGMLKIHNSNGTICAVVRDDVYITCASGKDRIIGLGCGKFDVVNKYTKTVITEGDDKEIAVNDTCFRKDCVHWVLLTEKHWAALHGMLTLYRFKFLTL